MDCLHIPVKGNQVVRNSRIIKWWW